MNGFAKKVQSFLKSLGGTRDKGEGKGKEEGEEDLLLEGQETEAERSDEDEDEEEEGMKKSGLVDATEILGSLAEEMKTLNKSLSDMSARQDGIEKSQADIGDAVVGVAAMVARIAGSPNPVKSAMSKGDLGGEAGGAASGKLSRAEFEDAQAALSKATREGRISIQKCCQLESDMQKAMAVPGFSMRKEDRDMIAGELKRSA
ncbi:MAG: hypothetical protein LBT33_08160 [Spirochaetia bacterium]|jgi:hypothetical protein|nr:hypothetical protein [Spirochaetia bacterium]